MEHLARFLILLAIAIAVRMLGRRVIPLAVPEGRLKSWAVGIVGGLVGHWTGSQWGIIGVEVAGLCLVWVVVGAIVGVLLLGIYPFIKVLLGGRA